MGVRCFFRVDDSLDQLHQAISDDKVESACAPSSELEAPKDLVKTVDAQEESRVCDAERVQHSQGKEPNSDLNRMELAPIWPTVVIEPEGQG